MNAQPWWAFGCLADGLPAFEKLQHAWTRKAARYTLHRCPISLSDRKFDTMFQRTFLFLPLGFGWRGAASAIALSFANAFSSFAPAFNSFA
jgi:hypothetical protein